MFKARSVKFRSSRVGTKARGRRGGRWDGAGGLALAGPLAMVLCVPALPAAAGPRGERVVHGEASFHREGRTTTITAGNRAIIEYDSFNIGRRQTVEFVQPGSTARVLNRITGADPTTIRGTLRSNGIVYIVNPAGVIFGPNSVVDVGGIYAAAATIKNQDFIAGRDNFTNVSGRVVNRGTIHADSVAHLIGRRVANFGTVVADTGTVMMVAGDEVWIGERGGHVYARFSTDEARERATGGVANHGTISAPRVVAGVGDYFALALFDPSHVHARIVEIRGGRGTTTTVAGVVDVSDRSPGGVGGSVTVTGERVALRGATIDASGDAGGGSVRIGGDYQGRGSLPTAERTYVSPGTTISADAVTQGDGGRVIVWSDVFTNYNGSITARGGSQGGDGGFAEVSGKETLAFQGTANLGAAEGRPGTLLLDPKNITIANGGADPVLANNEFGENPGADVTFDADLLTAILNTGTALALQANNDITVSEAIVVDNGGGDGGDLTLQAGRSVLINANITTDNGSLTIVANETVANGVQDAHRDPGAAVIEMANNVTINAGTGNVSMTISTGAGLTNSTSGNIFLENITTSGTVTVANNGPTAGSSILVDPMNMGGNAMLITAGNLALSLGGAGGGGAIGSSADPIAFTATNIEALGQSDGTFLDTTAGVNIGGASGSLTGLASTGGGLIELTAAGALTTSEAIAGSGDLTLTGTTIGVGANIVADGETVLTGPVTITGSRTISAGSGGLDFVNAVTLSGAGETVTLIGTHDGVAVDGIRFGGTVTPDAGGSTLNLELGNNSTAFSLGGGAGSRLLSAASIAQLQDGFTSIVIGRADGGQNITVGAVSFQDPVTIRTPTAGNINIAGTLTGTDNASVTLDPGAASRVSLNFTGTAITTANQDITFLGPVRVGEGFAATLASGGGTMRFGGTVDGTTGGAAESLVLNAGAGGLDFTTVASAISGAGGAADATGLATLTITNAGAVSVQSVAITGVLSTSNPLTGAFTSAGAVSAGTIDLEGAAFTFGSTATAGAGGISVDGTTLGFTGLVSTSDGGDITLDGSAITLTAGATGAGAGADIAITNSGLLTIGGAVTAAGSVTQSHNGGTVSVGADVSGVGVAFNSATTLTGSRSISAGTGALAFNGTLGFATAAATTTLTGGTIAFGANVTPNVGGTTLVFQSPTASSAFGVANGAGNQLISGASLAFLQNGFTQLVFGRSNGEHAIGIGASSFQDPVLFRTPTSGNITVTGLITGTDDASVTLDTGAGPARILLDVTGATITTAGGLIDLAGLVRIAEGEAPVLTSGGGTIRFGGQVDGTTGGAAESLTLSAGAGTIDFTTVASAISGASGSADATGLADVTITAAGAVSVQSMAITGAFSTSNPLTGALTSAGAVNAGTIDLEGAGFTFTGAVTGGAGGVSVSGGALSFGSTLAAGAGGIDLAGTTIGLTGLASTTGGGTIAIDGSVVNVLGGITTAGAGANVSITNSGLLTIGGAVTAAGTFTQVNNGGAVSLGAGINTSAAGGTIQFNSAVTATAPIEINAGAGAIDLNSTLAAGANSIVLTTNDFQPSGADTVSGTGSLTLRPATAATSIDLGTAATGATAAYQLADFAALADGFSSINIGYAVGGTHAVAMQGFTGGAALRDETFIHAPTGAGQITLLSDLETNGSPLTFNGDFLSGGNVQIDTNGGALAFNGDLGVGATTLTLTVGSVALNDTASGSGTLVIRPDAVGTAIDIGNVVGAGGVLQGGLVVSEATLGVLNDASLAGLEFGWAGVGEHSIQIGATTGAAAFNTDVSFHAPDGAGMITILADQSSDGSANPNADGGMAFNGDTRVRLGGGGSVTVTSSGLLSFGSAAGHTLDMNGNALALASADLDFGGGANSVLNSGAAAVLSLSPASASANIDIGDLGVNARGPGAWSLDGTDLAALDASVGALGFGTPVTGSHSIFIGLVDVGSAFDIDVSFNAPAAGGEAALFGDINSNGRSITFNAPVRIAEAATPTIATAGGDVSLLLATFGTAGGVAETLAINAGGGTITLDGPASGLSGGAASATGLTTLALTGGDIAIEEVTISGQFTADNAGMLDITGAIAADGGFAQTNSTLSGTSSVSLGADITTVNNTIRFESDVEQNGDRLLSAGTGLIEIGAGSLFDTAGADLTLRARRIDILGTLGGGNSASTLRLQPDAVGTPIEIGDFTANAAGALVLNGTDLGNIADGFGGIEIGFAGTGAHAFDIGAATFSDPVTLHAPAGSFTVRANRTLAGTDDASITLLGSHGTLTLNNGSRITTQGQNIVIDDDILLADGAGNSGTNLAIPLISTGTNGGSITIDGSIRGTDSGSGLVERIRLQAGTGTIIIGDVVTVNGTNTNVFGALSGMVQTASDQGLIDFRVVSAAGVSLTGVNIAGALNTETTLTGGFAASDLVRVRSTTMSGTTFSFDGGFSATNNGGGSVALTNSGLATTIDGEATNNISASGSLAAATLDAGGFIFVGGNLLLGDEAAAGTNVTVSGSTVLGDRIVAGNDITLTGGVGFSVNAGADDRGLFAGNTLTLGSTLDTAGQDTTLSGAEMNFHGGTGSISGGGALALRPDIDSRDINIGSPAAGNPGITSLDLTDQDLAAIASGFDSVTIGFAGGSHDIVFGSSTFLNDTIFHYENGTALISDAILARGDASLSFLGGDSGGTTLSANVTTEGGGIFFDDNVTLGGDSTLSNGGGNGTIEIDGSVDGPFSLIVQANQGHAEIDGTIGASAPLASLAVSGDSVRIGSGIGTAGSAGVTGVTGVLAFSELTLIGEHFNTNEAFYRADVSADILGAGAGTTATFSSNGSSITFADGGTYTIGSEVGLTVESGGGTISLDASFTGDAGAILFDGPVVLAGNTVVANTALGAGGTVTFADTVDGRFNLEVTTAGGAVAFQGDIGASAALASLVVGSAAGVDLANIGAGDEPGVDGASSITAGASINYLGTVYNTGAMVYTAGGAHEILAGPTSFATRGEDVEFAGGNIVLADGSDLSVSTEGGDGTFSIIRGHSDESVSIDLGAGTGTFAGIGQGSEIGDISLRLNDIAVNGDFFGDTLTIRGGTPGRIILIAGDNTPNVVRIDRDEFARFRDGFSSITIGSTVGINPIIIGGDGGGPLPWLDPLILLSPTNLGSVSVRGDLAGTGNASLTIEAGAILLAAGITTQGQDVTIQGATLLGADVSIATAGGNVSFLDAGTIDSDSTPRALAIDAGAGAVTIGGEIGRSAALASTDFAGGAISLRGVVTDGDQTYTGPTTLAGSLVSEEGAILIDGEATLAADISITAGQGSNSPSVGVTFRGPLIGDGHDLAVVTGPQGTASFEQAVTGIDTLSVGAGTINLAAVTSIGQQNYQAQQAVNLGGSLQRTGAGGILINGPVVLGDNIVISTVGGSSDDDITINGTVNGAFNLTMAAGAGNITTGAIGGTTRLDQLIIASAASTTLAGVRSGDLFQQTGTGPTVISGALDVTRSVDMTSGSFRFEGPAVIGNNLTLTAAEVSRFNGTVGVGGDARLLGGSYRIGNDASDTFDVGGGLEVNSTGNLIMTAPVIVRGAAGADITAADVVLSRELEVLTGEIVMNNAGTFTLESTGQVVLNGNNFRQIGTGQSNLARGIEGTGSNISFDGDVVLTADALFRGISISFNGRVDSDSGASPRALTLNSGGPVTLGGDVGSRSRLASLTTNPNGQTRLASRIFTSGPVVFGDNVVLIGDSRIDTTLGGSAGTVEFRGTINSAAGGPARSLTILNDVTILDHTLPTITFRGRIGGENPLNNLFLNYEPGGFNGRAGVQPQDININGFIIPGVVVPLVPTILVPLADFDPGAPDTERGFFIQTAGDFRMGVGEKLAVSFNYDRDGNDVFLLNGAGQRLRNGIAIDPNVNAPILGITVGGDSYFGDISVDGNLRVNSTGPIRFQQRAASVILPKPAAFQNQSNYPGDPRLLDVDRGTDLVVNGVARFNRGPSAPSGTFLGTADLAATLAAGPVGDLIPLQLTADRFNPNQFFMTPAESARVLGLSGFLFLDLRSEGTTGNQPPIFGQIPNESQSGTVAQATAIGSIAKRALADLGVTARDPDDLLDALIGRALYNDLGSAEGEPLVTANRMSLDIVMDLVNEFNAFFRRQVFDENGEPVFDPETGEQLYEFRTAELRATLGAAVQAYRRGSGGRFDAAEFRQFIRTNPEHADAERDLLGLESLLRQFQLLGLSSGEFAKARVTLLGYARPGNLLTDQQMIAIIDAGSGAPASQPPLLDFDLIDDNPADAG